MDGGRAREFGGGRKEGKGKAASVVLANRRPTLGPPPVGLPIGLEEEERGLGLGTAAYPGIPSDSVHPSPSYTSFSPSGNETAAGLAPRLNTFTEERLLANFTFFGVVGVVGNDSVDEFADDDDDESGSGKVRCNCSGGADAVLTCAFGDLSNDTGDPAGEDEVESDEFSEVILGDFNELLSGFPLDKKITGDEDVLSTCGRKCIPRGVSSGADGVGGLGEDLLVSMPVSSLGNGIAFVVGSWIFIFLVNVDREFSLMRGVYLSSSVLASSSSGPGK